MTEWIARAKELGFDTAAVVDPRRLEVRADVREMCAADRCGAYGRNWTCPPAVGTLEECRARIGQYRTGLLVQTVGRMEKTIDSRCYRETERRHNSNFGILAAEVRRSCPDALCLGAGGCRVCRPCAYPAACRFPAQAIPGMEAYGLFVTQVCRDAGVPYHHGERTITYTACILMK